MSTTMHSTDRRERGQSLAEFALVFPIFLLLVVAIFDAGRAVFAYNTVTNGAREGGRLAIVNQDPALISTRAIAQTRVAETNAPNVTVAFKRNSPNVDPLANPDCTPVTIGCVAVVTFQTTYQPITPLVGSIIGPVTMTARTSLPVEFACPNASIPSSANCPKQP